VAVLFNFQYVCLVAHLAENTRLPSCRLSCIAHFIGSDLSTSTSTATSTTDETEGVGLNSDDSKENLSREVCCEQVSAEGSGLRPELKEFIDRTLVPLLVDRYVEDMKKKAKEEAGMRMPSTSPPPVQ
jgi:hypothetical protein